MPWPGSSLLGCIVPAVAVSVVGALLAQVGQSPVAYGIPAVALTFAVLFVLVLIYQGSHAWVLMPGQIKRGEKFTSKAGVVRHNLGRPGAEPEKVERAREELGKGIGIGKVARLTGLGTGTVHRLKREILLGS